MLTCILYIPDSFTDIHNFPITEMICLSRYIKQERVVRMCIHITVVECKLQSMICLSRYIKQERVVRKCIYITVVECKLHFMICGSNL